VILTVRSGRARAQPLSTPFLVIPCRPGDADGRPLPGDQAIYCQAIGWRVASPGAPAGWHGYQLRVSYAPGAYKAALRAILAQVRDLFTDPRPGDAVAEQHPGGAYFPTVDSAWIWQDAANADHDNYNLLHPFSITAGFVAGSTCSTSG